jgi:hypothetical protein
MRPFLLLLAFVCAARLTAADLSTIRIWPGYRTAESFERISEFFTNRENASGMTLLRSQPDARAGYYFLTRIKNRGAEIIDAHVELSVITPDSPKPKRLTAFPAVRIPEGSHAFEIGLTGTDWAGAAVEPVAWRLRLVSSSGEELLREQSFLWSDSSPK